MYESRVAADFLYREPDTTIDRTMRKKLLWRSFFSTGCGWIAGNLFFIGYAWLVWGSLADVEVILFWTLPCALLGWLFFFVPLIVIIDRENGLFRLPIFTFVGAFAGPIAFFVLVGWWAPLWEESYAYLIHPAVTGATAATIYSAVTRTLRMQAG